MSGSIERAHQELGAAQSLADAGYPAQAVSSACYGSFFAAEAALLALDETRSKHSGVISAFTKLVVKDGACDPESGRLLRSLFDRRNRADYSTDDVPPEEARAAIEDARRVVDLVERWLTQRTH